MSRFAGPPDHPPDDWTPSAPDDERRTGRDPLHAALTARLPDFLQRQRWFGGKTRPIASVAVRDHARLPGSGRDMVVLADVTDEEETIEGYALMVSVRDRPAEASTIGPVHLDGRDVWLTESAADPQAVTSLLSGFDGPGSWPTASGGSLSFADADVSAARALAAATSVRAIGAEQSNTSVRVGNSLVFKLLRRLQEGENPELEIGRFLTTRTTFRAMSPLRGSLSYRSSAGAPFTLGVLQDWIESTGDGWTSVLSALRDGASDPRALERLGDDLARLGSITAAFHAAMASDPTAPDFAPQPVTALHVGTWAARLAAAAGRALQGARAGGLGASDGEALERALGRLPSSPADLAPPIDGTPGRRYSAIRIHGDYHLGQTLKTASGFALIDFEGEPTRPLAERRARQSALRDVAGMLRSFEYALETAGGGDAALVDRLRSALRPRERFLSGYETSEAAVAAGCVPADPHARRQWIRFFELDKALYELDYEMNNRPAWAAIPLRGILQAIEE
jgi:trehalose synthase-fused probable maltokinase